MIKRGEEKLNSEMDVLKLIRHVRYMRIFLKTTIQDKSIREKLKLADKNVIYIDTTSQESNDEEEDALGVQNGQSKEYKPSNLSLQKNPR
jgi:hypothetical protein